MTLRFNVYLGFVHCLKFQKLENLMFRKMDLFPLSGESHTRRLLCPLGRVSLSHWAAAVSINTATQTPQTRLSRTEM
jgi:hypothetical protein